MDADLGDRVTMVNILVVFVWMLGVILPTMLLMEAAEHLEVTNRLSRVSP